MIIASDVSVHHFRWLRFSSGNTRSGTKLQELCGQHGLRQLVDQPTREQYLLDLVLSDLDDIKCVVLPKLADHSSLFIQVPDSLEVRPLPPREVWDFAHANCSAMKEKCANHAWACLQGGTVEEACDHFVKFVQELAVEHFPQKHGCNSQDVIAMP